MSEITGDFDYEARIEELQQLSDRLAKQLRQAKQRSEEVVSATIKACYDAVTLVGVRKTGTPKKDPRKKSEEVALWHMTDFQGAKVTTSYNTEVMKHRAMRFVEKAIRITEIQRSDHPVKKCVIMFGGDMIEGIFNFPTQVFEIDATIFEQYVTVALLLVDIVQSALENYESVQVVSEWGNHGRIGSKRDAVPKSDNFDRMTYELSRRLLMNEPRLSWNDSAEDIQKVEIGAYRALLMHGDEVGRAGFASPSAWQAAGNRWKAGAYGWDFADVYLGHYHKNAEENLSDGIGMIYWTGSIESDNRYARDSMAASGVPSQRLHFIDPVKGRVTAKYQVYCDD